MFNMYIKATGGIVGWLFFMVLNLLGPIVRGIGFFLTVGGGLAFLLTASMWLMATLKHQMTPPGQFSLQFFTFTFLGTVLAGMSLMVWYEIMMDRMMIERLYPDEAQDDGRSWWNHFCDVMGLLALFVGFSFAAHYFYPKLPVFAWPAIGFFWWVILGVALGIIRWFYRTGTATFDIVAERLREIKGDMSAWFGVRIAVAPKKTKTQAEAKAHEEAHKVVSFRRRA